MTQDDDNTTIALVDAQRGVVIAPVGVLCAPCAEFTRGPCCGFCAAPDLDCSLALRFASDIVLDGLAGVL